MVPCEREKMFSGNNREREVESVIRQVGSRFPKQGGGGSSNQTGEIEK
jgi:hypothetical protein